MRRTRLLAAVLATSLSCFGCSHKAYNYLGPWHDENWIPHYVHKAGVVHMLVEPAPLPPYTYPDEVPYTLTRDDFDPAPLIGNHRSQLRFYAEQMTPKPKEYRFVHITDVQIRDRTVGLSPLLRRLAKGYTDTVEGSYYGDHADVFYFAHVLTAIRKGAEAGYFDAVVNGGDNVHLGMRSELRAYNYFMTTFLTGEPAPEDSWLDADFRLPSLERLPAPPAYMNMLGNHDRFIMGVFTRRFVALHWNETDVPTEIVDGWLPKLNELVRQTWTGRNDLGIPQDALRLSLGGYFAEDRPWPGVGKVRMIVLNTQETNLLQRISEKAALFPSISHEQFEWLDATLDEAQADDQIKAILVFGHNHLAEILVNRFPAPEGEKTPILKIGRYRASRDDTFLDAADLLGRHSKVVAYLCGHVHSGSPKIMWSENDPAIRDALSRANDRVRRKYEALREREKAAEAAEAFTYANPEPKRILHPFAEFINLSIQEYPKSFLVLALEHHPPEGASPERVRLRARYYNLNDILPPTGAALLDNEVTLPANRNERTALLSWRRKLNALTQGADDPKRRRLHLLAEYALAGEYDDLRIRSTHIELVYNPAIVADLLAIYRQAAEFMPYLKTFRQKQAPQPQAWEEIRTALELRATENNEDMMIRVSP
ncbi:MAG: metallophosphoesterase [Phycisphaerae bacterium]|nr:metallophosphoesterase [Phycisphaerae bacterium]